MQGRNCQFHKWQLRPFIFNMTRPGADLDLVQRVPEPCQHFQIDRLTGFLNKKGFFLVHGTVGSTVNSMALNIFKHCACTHYASTMQSIWPYRDSNPVDLPLRFEALPNRRLKC